MCFICNDTKIVYVPGNGNRDGLIPIGVDCPICCESDDNFDVLRKLINDDE